MISLFLISTMYEIISKYSISKYNAIKMENNSHVIFFEELFRKIVSVINNTTSWDFVTYDFILFFSIIHEVLHLYSYNILLFL